jgi:hypothetical protein
VFILFGGVLLVEALAYGCTPMAIAAKQTWLFTAFRILSGGGFATLTANTTPLSAYMFGIKDLHTAVAFTAWFEPLAGTGAAVAWLMHVKHKDQGSGSYDMFMYACSGIVGVAALLVAMLAADDAKRKRRAGHQAHAQT